MAGLATRNKYILQWSWLEFGSRNCSFHVYVYNMWNSATWYYRYSPGVSSVVCYVVLPLFTRCQECCVPVGHHEIKHGMELWTCWVLSSLKLLQFLNSVNTTEFLISCVVVVCTRQDGSRCIQFYTEWYMQSFSDGENCTRYILDVLIVKYVVLILLLFYCYDCSFGMCLSWYLVEYSACGDFSFLVI